MAERYRVRVLEDRFSIPWGHREVPGGMYEPYPNRTGTYTVFYSEMWDHKNNRPYPQSSPCVQWRGTYAGVPGIAVWDSPESWGEERVVVGGIGSPPEGPDVVYSISDANRFSACVNQTLSGSVLAPIVISELPQIKGTYDSLKAREFGVRSFANKYLAYKFGVAPFLPDLIKLANGSEVISQHILKVNVSKGVTTKSKLTVGKVSGFATWRRPTGFGTSNTEPVAWQGHCYTVVRTEVFRRYSEQDRLNLFADYYGGALLNVAWERIPYSFVVDWFANIGEVIDYVQPKFQPQMARLKTGCTIVKASVSLPVQTWSGFGPIGLGNREWQAFSRMPCPDITPSSLLSNGSGLTLSKIAIGGALLLQKL